MTIVPKIIDIYHDDNASDFGKAYAFGIRGVIHKATEGNTVTDRAYAARRPLALAAGMLWGAYHFMRPGDMVAQAKRFVAISAPDSKTLIAIDHEDGDVSLASLIQFYQALKASLAALGLRPKIKLYSGFLIKQQLPHATPAQVAILLEMDLWGCEYAPSWKHEDSADKPLPWSDIWAWQFTGDGEGPVPHDVPGIQTNMDISSFTPSDAALAAGWAAVASPMIPAPGEA